VLGVLDAADAERFAEHLRSCLDCRAAVAELGPAARLLQTAAPAGAPPAALQARTLASVAQAAQAARRGDRRNRWRGWNVRMLALAAAIVIAVGTGAGLELSRSSSGGESYPIALYPRAGLAASGQAVVRQAGSSWSVELTVAHLPDLGPKRYYECWWISPGNRSGPPESAGTFTVGPSGTITVTMSSAADPDNFPTMQIIAETPTSTGQQGQTVLVGTASD
jgi:anti-sigma-K factor RskA